MVGERLPSRRRILGYAGALIASFGAATGCDFLSTAPGSERNRSERKGKQAPILADVVKRGELPDVADRLPGQPLVVQPTERVGNDGGTRRTVLLGTTDTSWLSRTIGTELLLRYDPDWTTIIRMSRSRSMPPRTLGSTRSSCGRA